MTQQPQQSKLRKILDINLKSMVLEMDHELRANVQLVNGEHKITHKQPGMNYSKNGRVYMEKLGVVTAKGTKIDVVLYLNNGVRPDLSNAYWTYYTSTGERKKSGNSILVCNTKTSEGRTAYFNQKVEWNASRPAVNAAAPVAAPVPAQRSAIASSRKMW